MNEPFQDPDILEIVSRTKNLPYQGVTAVITGGAGFLGSTMSEVLLELGASVLCVDNLSSGRMENISRLVKRAGFEFIHHDISKPLEIDRKVDYIFHMASRASPLEFTEYPIQILKSNTLGTWNALGMAKKHGARVLFTSTSEIYGEAAIFPTPETYRGNVNTLGIRGCYDEAKRAGEAYCMAYHRQHGIDVRIVRIFNTYGPRMRSDGVYGRVIPRFIDQAQNNQHITIFGDGSQTRSFCYVTDQVTGLLNLAGREGLAGEVVNIGNPHEYTVSELAGIIIRLIGSSSDLSYEPLPQDDPMRRFPDISKAVRLLNFEYRIGLEEGLLRMIERLYA
ncbi:MAG: NAD-dependent dehydratase [Methanomicrobiales archaeon HGW-Methanomicrobiales-4]|nr:MAG: NAD-dependent dehydratase [Methanomicrobiales archaeon HGW-Methanomicrobiales-4]